jgi:hypothetical protein
MQKWEYYWLELDGPHQLDIDDFDGLGKAGWELVTQVGGKLYFFKRPSEKEDLEDDDDELAID